MTMNREPCIYTVIQSNGQDRIRTCEGVSQRIYSLTFYSVVDDLERPSGSSLNGVRQDRILRPRGARTTARLARPSRADQRLAQASSVEVQSR
jgi:hypothetical protein